MTIQVAGSKNILLHPISIWLAGLWFCAQAHSAPRTLDIVATQNAQWFRQDLGKPLTFVCPATDGRAAAVYGTDVYADYSAICAAAIHAGVLKPGRPGAVSIIIASGARTYTGTPRNGVMSRDYGAWDYHFTFVRDGSPGAISWTTVWKEIPENFPDAVLLACPPNGTTEGLIWGSEIYSVESSLCVAAAHSGAISVEEGGVITVRSSHNLGKFAAIERNGIASRYSGSSRGGFSVIPTRAGAIGRDNGNVDGSCPLSTSIARAFDEMKATVAGKYDKLILEAPADSARTAELPAQRNQLLREIDELKRQNMYAACPPRQQPTPGSIAGNGGSKAGSGDASGSKTGLADARTNSTGGGDSGAGSGISPDTVPVAGATLPMPNASPVLVMPRLAQKQAPPATYSNSPAPRTTLTAQPGSAPTTSGIIPSGSYLITVSELICVSPTKDNKLSLDGKGDEIYAAAFVRRYDRTNDKLVSAFSTKTRVYGDANGSDRLKAGGVSMMGGITAGNTIPDAGRVDRLTQPSIDRFPWQIWKGELRSNIDALIVSLSIWESDGHDAHELGWVERQSRLNDTLYNHNLVLERVADGTKFAPLVFDGATLMSGGVRALETAGYVVDMLTMLPIRELVTDASADRPIGMRPFDNSPGADIVLPNTMLVLTREIIESALTSPYANVIPSGLPGAMLSIPGPGYLVITFADQGEQLGPAMYQMVLRVERSTPTPQ